MGSPTGFALARTTILIVLIFVRIIIVIVDDVIQDTLPQLRSNGGGRTAQVDASRRVGVACPIFCTVEIVSVARFGIDSSRRRSRACVKVGSVVCFPLLHTPGKLRSGTRPALAIYNPTRNAA
jgi:hypothetical protein